MRPVTLITSCTVAALVAALGVSAPASARPAAARATVAAVASSAAVAAVAPTVTALPTATAVTLPPDGSFVVAANRVWRLVGGALVYVSSWTPYGGRHATIRLTAAQYAAVRGTHVRDGEFVRTIQDGRVYVVADGTPIYVSSWAAVGGVHRVVPIDARVLQYVGQSSVLGAGFKRWADLDASYADPDHRLSSDSFVSHFVRTLDGRVYVLTAGAPVYVSSWTPFGGPQRTVLIDAAAIDRAGQPGPWRFLRWYPENSSTSGLLVAAARPGAAQSLYAVAGGAPIYVPDTENFPEFLGANYPVDPVAVARAGTGGPFNHLRARPADGTFLSAMHDANPGALEYPSTTYWVSGGAAIPVVDAAACHLRWPYVTMIDQIAVDNAGTGGVWDHLAKPPVPSPVPPC
jgi:hypothetical protein